jgi:hypothetical protein
MGVGAGLGLLAGLFEALGWDEAAEVCSVLSAALMGVGAVLTTLPTIISTVSKVAAAASITV